MQYMVLCGLKSISRFKSRLHYYIIMRFTKLHRSFPVMVKLNYADLTGEIRIHKSFNVCNLKVTVQIDHN